MNDLKFRGIVSDVEVREYENRYHEAVQEKIFTLTEPEGLHPVQQRHRFGIYGERMVQYGDLIEEGAKVQVSFWFSGVKMSQKGALFNQEGVWNVRRIDDAELAMDD